MPDFQISLRDTNNNPALAVVGSTIQISDYSNYIASTEVGATKALFNFVYISILNLSTNVRYEISSAPYFDAVMAKPMTYGAVPYTTSFTFSADAVYEVQLISIPNYDKLTYDLGDFVVSASTGNIWKSLANTNTDDPSNPLTTTWELIGNNGIRTGYENISSKYSTTEYITVTCSLEQCLADVLYQANCIELNIDCNDVDLCKNKTWRNAMRLSMIIDIIQTLMDTGDYDKITTLINEGNTICSCCN